MKRTEKEIHDLVLQIAQEDERIRVVGMNGSRVNTKVTKDELQDFDFVYVVNDMKSFIDNPRWIDVFGEQVIVQMPEAMELFEPELGNWFSYLILLSDYNRIDLILVPLEELDMYLADDKLCKILLDKDNRITTEITPSDEDYWTKAPSALSYDDCCNEFWWLSTYVMKGLVRKQLLFANDHLHLMRQQLIQILKWEAAFNHDFKVNLGKSAKYLQNYVSKSTWETLMKTYRNDTSEHIKEALEISCDLFSKVSMKVANNHNYLYPDYEEKVTTYLREIEKLI